MSENNNKLSASARYVIELCKRIISDVQSGECSEEEISSIITRTEPRHNGYINPRDYLNADNAAKYVGVGRAEFFSLIKRFKVKATKINNLPIGYDIKQLDKIRHATNKEVRKATRK